MPDNGFQPGQSESDRRAAFDLRRRMRRDAAAAAAAAPPIGAMTPFLGTAAPDGWALLDGSTIIGGQFTFPDLWTILPAAYKSGSDIVLPNMKGRVIVGFDAAQTEFNSMGEVGGAKTVTLTDDQSGLRGHTHADTFATGATSHTHGDTFGTATESANHTHNFAMPTIYTGGAVNNPGIHLSGNGGAGGPFYTNGGTGLTNFSGAINTSGVSANHAHSITGSVSSESAHVHPVTGSVTAVAAANATQAHNNLQPYITMNYIMRLA